MLNLTWIEYFLRVIPEALIVTWGILVIAKESLKVKKYILISIIASVVTFLVRKLPIYFGMHTIIIMIILIYIMSIAGLRIVKTTYSNLLAFFLLSVSELINVIILKILNVNVDINSKDIDPIYKSLIGIPSLIIFVVFIKLIFYFTKGKKD